MAYSGNPAGNPVDAVRYELGDTTGEPLLSDAEINYEIARQEPLNGADPVLVAAFCADAIASRYAGQVTVSGDGESVALEQLQQKYQTLAVTLRKRYESLRQQSGGPVAGGTLRGQRPSGTRPLNFAIGMDDNPVAGVQRGQRDADGQYWDDTPEDALT